MFSRLSPIAMIMLALALGSIVDVLAKLLSETVSVLLIVTIRFAVAAALSVGVFVLAKRPMPPLSAYRFHLMRGMVQVGAALCFFYALSRLDLALVTLLAFTAGLMIGPVGWVLLGERLRWRAGIAALLGFAGVLVAVLTAGAGATPPPPADGIAAALLAAFLFSITMVLLRLRARVEDTVTIVMLSNVLPAGLLFALTAVVSLFAPLDGPSLAQLPALGLIGALGMAVWALIAIAYGRAPAQRLAPFEYTALIWGTLYGVVIFDETPGASFFAGAALVILACVLVATERTPAPSSD